LNLDLNLEKNLGLGFLKKHGLDKIQIEQVFKTNQRFSSKHLFFLFRKNQINHPRICFILAKKKTKSAVQRNLIRRLAKEFFRLAQHDLPSFDVVLLTNMQTKKASKQEFKICLKDFFEFLKKQKI